ncbi:MAG: putative PurR-regulated permease PerM [Saprospiraceae bacterium]|jgi:predicted PurR-regulated permease PerM
MNKTFNIQRFAHLLIVICLVVYILSIGKNIITPIVFAMFFAFMLKPVSDFFEKHLKNRVVSILVSFIVALVPIVLTISLFAAQSVDVFTNMPAISGKIKNGINKIFSLLNQNFGFSKAEGEAWLSDNISSALDAPMQILGGWLSTSSTLLISILLVLLYTFFFLLYRTSIKNFLLGQFTKKQREDAREGISNIQSVAQKYLSGLAVVILILGLLNGFGLFIIGIEYAFFWGFLGAFLAIIPYIGTIIGGMLPFAFAIATTNTMWQPLAIIALYSVVQTIEGNLITPKVVGSSVEINPLAAIISLLIGGAIWGVSGLILALPLLAITRIVFEHIDMLKPVALLLSSELYRDREKFLTDYDKEENRIANYFKRKEKIG